MDWTSLLCQKRLRDILDGKPSTSGKDHRTEFEKDYDRVIYSTPFRRLQDKAQVFPLESHDAVHTRLAHSMEVARVAKGLAQKVFEDAIKDNEDFEDEKEKAKKKRDIATIAEVCGLVHDFGNPPFGHAGEEAMRDWFRKKLLANPDGEKVENGEFIGAGDLTALGRRLWNNGPQYLYDFLRFDGNAHTIRLLSRLQVVAHYRGLNLTAGTMAAALKYLPPSHEVIPSDDDKDHPYGKPGYLASEQRVVEKVRDITGTGENRNPITVLVEAADDIVNSLIDLEDALRKGVLTWEDIKDGLRSRLKSAGKYNQFDEIKKGAEEVVKGGEAELNGDKGEAQLRMFRTFLIGKHVEAVSSRFEERYNEIMEGGYPFEILGDEETETSELAEACDDLKFDRVIPSRDVIKLEYMGRNVMQDLMDMFWEGAKDAPNPNRDFNQKIHNLSSQNYRSVFEHTGKRGFEKHENGSLQPELRDVESIHPLGRSQYCPEETGYPLPSEYQRLQLVADQVCGMTDSYACQLHRELTNR